MGRKVRRDRICEDCRMPIPTGPRLKCRFCGMRVCTLCWSRRHSALQPGDICTRHAPGDDQLQLFS